MTTNLNFSENSASDKAPNDLWWRGGVIYQLYPRSFQDSNGDGIGDLPGITQRLPYIAKLGVDGIWISPFFKSPMKDFGYDVSDYCDVDPMFGTLNDCRVLVDTAHRLGLKVMIDHVLSHTSDVHPWFVESRSCRANAKADWYVWADAKSDGTPPNNWLSIFGGSAWQWDTRREQYYLHNFLTSQPDLNFHHPLVQENILKTVKFWLDFGVDGYRLDTVNFYVHDAKLRDNPPRGKPQDESPAVSSLNPYSWQWHQFDKSQPENLVFLQKLRRLLDAYPNTTMVGEIGDDDGLARVAQYTSGGDKLHMAYCFELLGTQRDTNFLHQTLERFEKLAGDGWPCWALSNHDVTRWASRWFGAKPSSAQLQLGAAFLLSLRGSVCLYQGEELGLTEAEITFEQLQDPYGITMWPEYKGRDGCRTPMPWDSSANAGFSPKGVATWLPVAREHLPLSVNEQQDQPGSLLNFYTHLLHWRKKQPALIEGTLTLMTKHPQVLAYVRDAGKNSPRLLCVFNFSSETVVWQMPESLGATGTLLNDSGLRGVSITQRALTFMPWGAAYLELI